MNALKERILGAITVMNAADTLRLWEIIAEEFGDDGADWDMIPDEEPDDIDIRMLREIEADPDCGEFMPSSEAEKILSM